MASVFYWADFQVLRKKGPTFTVAFLCKLMHDSFT